MLLKCLCLLLNVILWRITSELAETHLFTMCVSKVDSESLLPYLCNMREELY